jgi:hypothetical protein
MKRMLLPVLASSLLAAFVPAVASAHRGHHHHGQARSHQRHARSARLLNFGAAVVPLPPGGTPPEQATPSNQAAGKVESFEGGVLKIKLSDNSTVSGKVTEETELRCQPATPPTETGDDDGDGAEGGSEGDEHHGSSAPSQFTSQHGDFLAHSADSQQGGDNQGDEENGAKKPESCTTSALVPNAVVLEAKLKLSSAGAVWEKLDIVH